MSASDGAIGVDELCRAMYLAREYRLVASLTEELQGMIVAPVSGIDSCHDNAIWRGIVFVRSKASPWFEGAFPFHILFPPKYPFDCPVAAFDEKIPSNALLEDGIVVRFESEYFALSPAHISICVRLLKFVRRIFYRKEEEITDELRVAARRDVERSSIFQIDCNDKYFKRLMDEDVTKELLARSETRQLQQHRKGMGDSKEQEVKAGNAKKVRSGVVEENSEHVGFVGRTLLEFDQWYARLFNAKVFPYI